MMIRRSLNAIIRQHNRGICTSIPLCSDTGKLPGAGYAEKIITSTKPITNERYTTLSMHCDYEDDPSVCPSLKATGDGHAHRDPSWNPDDSYHPVFATPFKHTKKVIFGGVLLLTSGIGATLFLYGVAQRKAGIL